MYISAYVANFRSLKLNFIASTVPTNFCVCGIFLVPRAYETSKTVGEITGLINVINILVN